MRWSLVAVRLSIVAVNLVIAAIIIMSILPLATGKLQVSIPEEGGGEPVMDGNRVTMSVPVDITNDGYFNIEDLTIRFKVTDGAKVLTEQSSVPVDVIAGRTNHLNLSVTMDLDDISEQQLKDLVFNPATLGLEVSVDAGYSLGLVRASIATQQEMDWEPIVSNVNVYTDNLQWEANGTNVDVLVPYYFEASDFAQGKSASIAAQLSNSTTALATSHQDLTISGTNSGTLRFVVPQETFLWMQSHPQEGLTLDADVTIMGATMHLERTVPTGAL